MRAFLGLRRDGGPPARAWAGSGAQEDRGVPLRHGPAVVPGRELDAAGCESAGSAACTPDAIAGGSAIRSVDGLDAAGRGTPGRAVKPEAFAVPGASTGPARDQGSATVWGLVVIAVLCLVFGVVLALGQAVVARHRAAAGADLAALAAADHWARGDAAACERADRIARAQGTRLVRCVLVGQVSDVTASSGRGPFAAEVRARAGPEPEPGEWSGGPSRTGPAGPTGTAGRAAGDPVRGVASAGPAGAPAKTAMSLSPVVRLRSRGPVIPGALPDPRQAGVDPRPVVEQPVVTAPEPGAKHVTPEPSRRARSRPGQAVGHSRLVTATVLAVTDGQVRGCVRVVCSGWCGPGVVVFGARSTSAGCARRVWAGGR